MIRLSKVASQRRLLPAATLILATLGLFAASSAGAQPFTTNSTTAATLLGVSQVFVPPGFDDNDNAQIIIRAVTPNTCYKIAPALSHVDLAQNTITIAAQAYPTGKQFCGQIMVTYNQTINLGRLPAGNYRVIQMDPKGQPGIETTLNVAQASSASVEDDLLASVDQVFIENTGGTTTARIVGTLPNSCYSLQEVRVLHRAPHIIEMLPIMTRNTEQTCDSKSVPFDITQALPAVEPGPWLLYTRSINGQSLVNVQAFPF